MNTDAVLEVVVGSADATRFAVMFDCVVSVVAIVSVEIFLASVPIFAGGAVVPVHVGVAGVDDIGTVVVTNVGIQVGSVLLTGVVALVEKHFNDFTGVLVRIVNAADVNGTGIDKALKVNQVSAGVELGIVKQCLALVQKSTVDAGGGGETAGATLYDVVSMTTVGNEGALISVHALPCSTFDTFCAGGAVFLGPVVFCDAIKVATDALYAAISVSLWDFEFDVGSTLLETNTEPRRQGHFRFNNF